VWFPNAEHRLRAQVLGSWTTAQPVGGTLVKGELASSHAFLGDWAYESAKWHQYIDVEDVGRDFRADNGFIAQNGYRRIYSETMRKFVGAFGLNEVSPYLNAEYKTDPDGKAIYQQSNVGVRVVLPRATTLAFEYRPNNLVGVREEGGLRKRDQVFFSIDTNPFPWLAKLYSEIAYGDRVDVFNNRTGKGHFYTVQLSLRPHPRAEVEYRIDNDTIDSLERVEGSNRILLQRVQQLLAIWHFSSRDSLRAIWQLDSRRRAASLWEDPISHHERYETVSLTYGHRRGINATLYVGANVARALDPDAAVKTYQAELFLKGSWTFDVL